MTEVPNGLAAWARRDGPSIVLAAVRRRAQQGHRTELGTLRIALTSSQRREVARLIGTPWEVSGRPVRLQDLAAALSEHGLTVRGLVEALDGRPLDNLREQRAEKEAAVDAERSTAATLLKDIGVSSAHAHAWLADAGLPRPGDGALLALAEETVRIWRHLPGEVGRGLRLAELAAAVLDDAHALDYREPLGKALSRLIAVVHGLSRPLRAGRDWRRAWAAAGVRCDGVSSRVLVLNLPLLGDAPAARWSTAVRGEPLWLSLRSLTGQWSVPASCSVFVCENPTVVEAAADELGPRCPALVCTDGIPTSAALDLVAGLAAHGSSITVRADIDAAGFVVVDQLRAAAPTAATWRYDPKTYLDGLGIADAAAPAGDEAARLCQLRELYAEHRTPLHEEALLEALLGDLAQARGR